MSLTYGKNMNIHSHRKGQPIIEFIASLGVFIMVIYATVKILDWAGKEMIGRQRGHENTLTQDADFDADKLEDSPMKQLEPYVYYEPRKIKAPMEFE